MRKARSLSPADIKWRDFLADPGLRAYIMAFCSVAPARATDIVFALEADAVPTALDGYCGTGTRIQSISTLMSRMAQQEGLLTISRALIGGQEWTVYEPVRFHYAEGCDANTKCGIPVNADARISGGFTRSRVSFFTMCAPYAPCIACERAM